MAQSENPSQPQSNQDPSHSPEEVCPWSPYIREYTESRVPILDSLHFPGVYHFPQFVAQESTILLLPTLSKLAIGVWPIWTTKGVMLFKIKIQSPRQCSLLDSQDRLLLTMERKRRWTRRFSWTTYAMTPDGSQIMKTFISDQFRSRRVTGSFTNAAENRRSRKTIEMTERNTKAEVPIFTRGGRMPAHLSHFLVPEGCGNFSGYHYEALTIAQGMDMALGLAFFLPERWIHYRSNPKLYYPRNYGPCIATLLNLPLGLSLYP